MEKRWLVFLISVVAGVLIGAGAADLPTLGRGQFFATYGDFLGSVVGGLIAVLVAWWIVSHERQEMRKDRANSAGDAAAILAAEIEEEKRFINRRWDSIKGLISEYSNYKTLEDVLLSDREFIAELLLHSPLKNVEVREVAIANRWERNVLSRHFFALQVFTLIELYAEVLVDRQRILLRRMPREDELKRINGHIKTYYGLLELIELDLQNLAKVGT